MNIQITPNEFIPVMQKYFNENLSVTLTVTGNSMVPFLADKRDSVILSKYKNNAKKGDILFYFRDDNRCVLHRVFKINDTGIFFVGDNQTVIEGPVSADRILAECNSVIRKGKLINESSFIWLFFKHIWINIIKFRKPIINFIAKIR